MTGFFGSIKYNLLPDDYKETSKTNPFIEYKRVLEGFSPDQNMLIPLVNWFSNHKLNITTMQRANRNLFYNKKSIIAHYIALNINRSVRFIKYPKTKKEPNELDFLIPYILRYYSWSQREYEFHKDLINLEDRDLHLTLHRAFALEKKELRKLGIKQEKIKVKFEKHQRTRGFF